MNDPVYAVTHFILNSPSMFPEVFGRLSPIVNILFVILAICLLKSNLGGVEERRAEREWADICGTILDRMNSLLPIYAKTNADYLRARCSVLTNNRSVVESMRSISTDTKQEVTKDFCLRDASHPEDLAVLQMQLDRLMGTKGETT